MIVVEAAAGQQKAYSSVHELGTAIRRGELGAEARIYHRATDQWLPITVHPEYRRVAEDHERRSALALRMRQWTFLRGDDAAEYGGGALEAEGAADPAAAAGPWTAQPRRPVRSWLSATMRRLRGRTP